MKDRAKTDRIESDLGIDETSDSLSAIYMRRFRRHTLGKLGAAILALLYLAATLADFLSPFDMTWTDKTKSYHPPTNIYFSYRDGDRVVPRPFVYEKHVVNRSRKQYGVVPLRTMRAVSLETRPDRPELRVVAGGKAAPDRRRTIVEAAARHYGLPLQHRDLERLAQALDDLEARNESDAQVQFRLGMRDSNAGKIPMDLMLSKGNKNFIGFICRGTPYRFLGVFATNLHFFGSPTGGFFLMGADQFGRDVLSRLLHGARISLSVGLLGAIISFTIGLLIGGIAGYFGGIADVFLMRASEIVIAFPAIYLLFALRATFPPTLNSSQVYLLIVLILSFVGWASLARVIRGMVLSIKNEEYVLSARSLGLSHRKIIMRHILPNTLSVVIIQATLQETHRERCESS